MNPIRTILVFTAVACLAGGCVSVHSLPQSAKEVDFEPSNEGRTGWSKYEEVVRFNGVDKRTAYLAAKAGMADAGFTIKRANYEAGMVAGEHGMTAYDWNIVAGVYVRSDENGTDVKVQVEGSKDIGFWGDMTAESWPQAILKGMRNYIATENGITNPNRKIFQ